MEVKEEISKIIDSLPESALNDVLILLRDMEKAAQRSDTTEIHLQAIIKEDHKLLQALAK